MYKAAYDKLLKENIVKSYKRTATETVNSINKKAKGFATCSAIVIQDRAESFPKNQSFVTLKDYKENFENERKCRSFNTAKSTIGRVNKEILERITNELRKSTNVQQWRNP